MHTFNLQGFFTDVVSILFASGYVAVCHYEQTSTPCQ